MARVMTAKRMQVLHRDPVASARLVQLRYVKCDEPGIQRLGGPKRFRYAVEGRALKDVDALLRIRSLALPPAWTKVWICADERGHLQATGHDARERKQYRYHPEWSKMRGQVKFAHLADFARCLPLLRAKVKADLKLPGLPLNKVLATVVSVMERTHIRIGQEAYAKENGSFGLSTMKDKHVRKTRDGLRFIFTGKRGIKHDIALGDRVLERTVLRCRELPGQDLFRYLDEDGEVRSISSTMVNDYIRSICGGTFSSKDIRTWKGSLTALRELKGKEVPASERARTIVLNEALDAVALALGNTRAVCKKHYVYPGVLEAFAEGRLLEPRSTARKRGLTPEELLLMKLLERPAAQRTMARAA